MKATSTDRKTVQVTENGELIGQLIYDNLFSLAVNIRMANSEVYTVKPVGFFGTTITVTKAGVDVATLKMNWHGQIIFAFQDGEEFALKAKGLFYNKFVIENKDEEQVLQLDPKFNWSKFDYSYDIAYEGKPQNRLLVMLGVYASNYLIATMSGMV
ncbi:hypothetical protein ACAW74_24020 [Fibrella sp. WM1]|uniref:hypothetical protein n=1 Tax=Fibrella musci TaxID=3242485 RepID=UPI00351FF20B